MPDAVRVVWHRARVMQQASGLGRMAAVALDAATAADLVRVHGERLSIGAINAPRSVVLSGESSALEAVLASLDARGVSVELGGGEELGHREVSAAEAITPSRPG